MSDQQEQTTSLEVEIPNEITVLPTTEVKNKNYLPHAVVIALLFGYFGVKPIVDFLLPTTLTAKEVTLIAENNKLKAEAKALKDKEEADQQLGQYTLNVIAKTRNKVKFSDAKKQIVARAVVRVATEIFDTVEHQHAFVAVLAIESEFNRLAKSGGTIEGIGQTARGSFHEGLGNCGLPKADDGDITELDLGLYASACYYKALLVKFNNDPYMAIVGYNQGGEAKATKSYAANGTLDNTEALKYISRFTYLTRNVTDKKDPNGQNIDLKAKKAEPKADK